MTHEMQDDICQGGMRTGRGQYPAIWVWRCHDTRTTMRTMMPNISFPCEHAHFAPDPWMPKPCDEAPPAAHVDVLEPPMDHESQCGSTGRRLGVKSG